MNDNRAVIRQFFMVALCEAICVALMLGVYALAGLYTTRVLIGALIGFFLASGNFLAMSISVCRIVDQAAAAANGETKSARLSIQVGSSSRLIILAIIYIVILRLGFCDPIAAILPLLFVRISIILFEFFTRNGGKTV